MSWASPQFCQVRDAPQSGLCASPRVAPQGSLCISQFPWGLHLHPSLCCTRIQVGSLPFIPGDRPGTTSSGILHFQEEPRTVAQRGVGTPGPTEPRPAPSMCPGLVSAEGGRGQSWGAVGCQRGSEGFWDLPQQWLGSGKTSVPLLPASIKTRMRSQPLCRNPRIRE